MKRVLLFRNMAHRHRTYPVWNRTLPSNRKQEWWLIRIWSGDFRCTRPQHSEHLPWPNQDPFEEKSAMDDIAYCLSYSELAIILATAAMNMLTFLALCIMTRKQCIKDGCMSWHVYTESWIQTYMTQFTHMYHPVTIDKRNPIEKNEWR